MKTLRIREIDHTIQPPIAWEKFEAPNEFVASLVAAAVRDGTATMDDSEGCPVTATVWEECAEAANRPALVYAVNCNASIDGVVRRKTGMGKTKFFTEQVTGGSRGEASDEDMPRGITDFGTEEIPDDSTFFHAGGRRRVCRPSQRLGALGPYVAASPHPRSDRAYTIASRGTAKSTAPLK